MTEIVTSLTILIVEDNPGDALLLEEYLKMSELDINDILHTTTVGDALIVSEKKNPDIIFLDLTLSDSKGFESFITINAAFSHIPVIILSGLQDTSVTLEAIAAGAQDYIVKGDLSVGILQKSVQYSIERKKSLESVRLSNERFNAISTASHDSIWDWNLRTGDFYSNEAMCQTLGYCKEEVSNGHAWWYQHLHKEDRDRANNNLQQALISGDESWQHEYRFICGDGTVKYIFGRGTILRDSTGTAYRLIGIMQDITNVYLLQETLAEEKINRQKQLAQATIEGQEKERSELGKELHDNINQLLAATKLYLSVATNKADVKDEMIKRSINSLNYCMEEIRKLSKALVPPSIGVINLAEAIHDLAETMQLADNIIIETYIEDGSKALSNKDQLNIYRIVQEQLNNIIKHAGATKAQITLIEQNGFVEVMVQDNGKGFSTSSKNDGIGLKNIQNRSELLNGEMTLISEPGLGCTLKILIPVETEDLIKKTAIPTPTPKPLTVDN